ncbi:MAG: insulinase family protein [Candidatus Eiseniibacteriota bacterium]|nr:MAG: insulinase family protein [Candidatus Eisenbacteria bacterium]
MLRVIALVAAVAVLSSAAPAEVAGAKPASGVEKTVLETGLTVLVKESDANDVVSVQLFAGMGAKYESDGEAGVSGLLQQCILKGTKSRTAEDIVNEIESVGGRLESGTTKETGFVQLTCTTEGLAKGLEVLFDVMANPTFPAAEVEKEKELIAKRMKQKKDRLLVSAIDLAQEVLYEKHPFHKPGEGYEKTVASLGREHVVEAYRRFYVPRNMVIAAVGNLDAQRFVEDVRRMLGAMGVEAEKPTVVLPEVSLESARQELSFRESSSVWLVIAYPTPGVLQDDYYAARVLDCILGGSMDSRLFTELRDKKGLGYAVRSFYAGFSRDAFVGAYIGTKPGQFEIARDGILGEVEKLRNEEVTDEELGNTKRYLRGAYMIRLESNANQAYDFAYYECVGAGYDYPDRYLEGIQTVTKADVIRIAKKYFEAYALASILPEQVEAGEGGKEQEKEKTTY